MADNRRSATTLVLSRGSGTLWMLVTAWVLLGMLVMVPEHEEVFKDFGVELPVLTRMLISASRELRGANPGQAILLTWVIGPLWITGILGATIFCAARRTPWAGVAWGMLAVMAGLVFTMMLVTGLFVPLVRLTQQFQQGG
jgi:hypothetical protein